MRFCCDEKCDQGRNCPKRMPVNSDWFDRFALGICAVSFVVILLMLFV
jgi:hypothetical protein